MALHQLRRVQLIREVQALKAKIAELEQEKLDAELLLETTINHSDRVEELPKKRRKALPLRAGM
jgi:hypothetical protein